MALNKIYLVRPFIFYQINTSGMKKITLIILIFFFSINASCQSETKIKFGFKTGLAFSSARQEYLNDAAPVPLQSKTSLLIETYLNVKIKESLYFQPALIFLSKGPSYSYGTNYFEIPLDILHKLSVKNGMFFLGGGLSPAFKVSTSYGSDDIKRFDLGLNALATYQTSIGFSISLSYTYGLLNLSNNKTYITNYQNRYLSVCVGYEF